MNECKLPIVYIFEGGDVTGKTTQSELFTKKLKNSIRFKFPNRTVNLTEDKTAEDSISKCKELDIILNSKYAKDIQIGEPNSKKYDIYKLFDKTSKCIYNQKDINKFIEILDDINGDNDSILNLIKLDIILNAYDKFQWIKNEYYTIVKENKYDNIILDRFILSGSVYNTYTPIRFIRNKLKYNFYKWNLSIIKKIYTFKEITDNILYELIYKINVRNSDLDISKFNFFEMFVDGYNGDHEFDVNTDKLLINFKTLLFKPSSILYSKFEDEIKNKSVNREVSNYDTNMMMKCLVNLSFAKLFDKVDCIIDTDYFLTLSNDPSVQEYYKTNNSKETFYHLIIDKMKSE